MKRRKKLMLKAETNARGQSNGRIRGWNRVKAGGTRSFPMARCFKSGTKGLETNCWASLTLPTDLTNKLTEVPLPHFTQGRGHSAIHSPKISEVLEPAEHRGKKDESKEGLCDPGEATSSLCSVSPSVE